MLAITTLATIAPFINVHVDAQANCAIADGTLAAPYCTVTDALNASVDGDVIMIAPGTYTEMLDIAKDVSLVASGGADVTTLSADDLGPVVTIRPGVAVRIAGLTIRDGLGLPGPASAGGIQSNGELILVNSIVRNSTVRRDSVGALAIHHSSPDRLIVDNCTIRNNVYLPNGGGGAGVVMLDGSGAALFEDTTITANTFGYRNSIYANGGALVVRGCTISDNYHGGGFWPGGGVTIDAGSLRLENSTIDGNGAAGLVIESPAGPIVVESCTITGNTGLGFYAIKAYSTPTVQVGNSVIFGKMEGTFVSLGTNYLSVSPYWLLNFSYQPSDLYIGGPTPLPLPRLLPLADNGGPTMTRLPDCGSPLIDSGPQVPSTGTDQRGFVRPVGRIDRGAAEADCVSVVSCVAEPNSTGAVGQTEALGPVLAADNDILLQSTSLPPGVFGIFLVSAVETFTPHPGGSAGNLCLGGTIGRFVGPGEIFQTDATGAAALQIDLTALPQGGVTSAAVPGDTWLFQSWHRDVVGASQTSNYAEAVALTVR